MKNIKLLLLNTIVLLFSFSIHEVAAQGWENIVQDSFGYTNADHLTTSADGNYVIAGFASGILVQDFGAFARKLNGSGQTIWTKRLPDEDLFGIYGMPNNTVVCHGGDDFNSYNRPKMITLDAQGNIIFSKVFPFAADFAPVSFYDFIPQVDGTFIYLRNVSAGGEAIGFIDAQGNITNEIFGSFGADMRQLANGNLVCLKYLNNSTTVTEYDIAGIQLSTFSLPLAIDHSNNTGFTINEKLLIDKVSKDIYVLKHTYDSGTLLGALDFYHFEANQNLVTQTNWYNGRFKSIRTASLVSNGILVNGFEGDNPDPTGGDAYTALLDFNGNVIFDSVISFKDGPTSFGASVEAIDGGFISSGFYDTPLPQAPVGFTVRMDGNGVVYSNLIAGTVAGDDNLNCLHEAGETPIQSWIVTAYSQATDRLFSSNTDENGYYQIPVDSGSYLVTVHEPNDIWVACENNITFDFLDFNNFETNNFAISKQLNCTNMSVSGVMNVARPCFERPVAIQYCNNGSIVAENAYLELNLGGNYTLNSSTIPYTINGEIVTFELGDVDPLACGNFQIGLELACDAPLDAAFCIEFNAFPQDPCETPAGWSGAFLRLTPNCNEIDEIVSFTVENIGTATTPSRPAYFIVEDAVLMMQDSIPNLAPTEDYTLPFNANGATYIMSLEQVANAPGNSMPLAFVEGCGTDTNGEFSTGFATQFPLDDFDPYVDIDCPIIVNSYDPNDKRGLPLGYGVEHYILPETKIEYRVRFQNTGTDTAFTVVVRDTLDSNLDITTFREGASSHAYNLDVVGENILVYTFNNIMLPDSNVNEPGSNGFFEFSIIPKRLTPLETVITNDAAIYFDFNEPIYTNETYHRLGIDFITISVGTNEQTEFQNVTVSVIPNPLQDRAIISIENHDAKEFVLSLNNVNGQLIRQEKFESANITFHKKNLISGIYFFTITSDQGFITTGKIVVQ